MSSTTARATLSHNFCVIEVTTSDVESIGKYVDIAVASLTSDLSEETIARYNDLVDAPSHNHAVAVVKQELGGTVVSDTTEGGPEMVTDKYGNEYTYNHAEAPTVPDTDGKAVLKVWTDKSGKPRKAWVHPKRGPRPSSLGGDIDFIQWV